MIVDAIETIENVQYVVRFGDDGKFITRDEAERLWNKLGLALQKEQVPLPMESDAQGG